MPEGKKSFSIKKKKNWCDHRKAIDEEETGIELNKRNVCDKWVEGRVGEKRGSESKDRKMLSVYLLIVEDGGHERCM